MGLIVLNGLYLIKSWSNLQKLLKEICKKLLKNLISIFDGQFLTFRPHE